jgi:hypothetical protein
MSSTKNTELTYISPIKICSVCPSLRVEIRSLIYRLNRTVLSTCTSPCLTPRFEIKYLLRPCLNFILQEGFLIHRVNNFQYLIGEIILEYFIK